MAAINLEESNYQSALFLIDKLEGIRLSSNICMLKAQIYKHMDNPILALSEYKKASNINPKLLRPKYEIMKYYQYLNKPQYAKLWAKEIIKTPVKIKSSITELIQKRAKKTLIE